MVMGSPFKVDWMDLTQVINYAKQMGPGHSVIKFPDRDNYNITHTEREKKYPYYGEAKIIYRTDEGFIET